MRKEKIISLVLLFAILITALEPLSVSASADTTPLSYETLTTEATLSSEEATAEEIESSEIYSKKATRATLAVSEWKQYTNYYFYNQMSESEKAFYDKLDAMCLDYLENNTNIDSYLTAFCEYEGMSLTEAIDVALVFFYSNPQYYFITAGTIYYKNDDTHGGVAFSVYEQFRASSDREAATEEFKEGINSYLTQIDQTASLYEQEIQLHDLLIVNTDYIDCDLEQSPYSVFVQKTSVCIGYARSFNLLCNAIGIPCLTVANDAHSWNYACLNDIWYIVDITWDDWGTSASYDCFNRSTAEMNIVDEDGVHVPAERYFARYLPTFDIDSGSTADAPAATLPTPEKTLSAPTATVINDDGQCTITLSSDVDGAKIYYTTDGTTPSESNSKSTLYTGEFSVSESTTVNVIAVYSGYYTSEVSTLNLMPAVSPVVTEQLDHAVYEFGANATKLKVTASVSDGGSLTYQWYQNGTSITGATSASYTPATTSAGTKTYYCVVTNTQNGTTSSVTSKTVTITVNTQNISISKQPVSASYKYKATAAKLSVAVSALDKDAVTYQWYKNSTNSTKGATSIKNATSASYTPATTSAGTTYYYCVVTNTQNKTSTSITSSIAKISVKAQSITITKQPVSKTYALKASASKLSVTTASLDSGKLTYQWYKNSTSSTKGATSIKNATSASYTPATTSAGTTYYYCVITNTQNGVTSTATSSVAKIVVNRQSIKSVNVTGISSKTYTGSAIKQSIKVTLGSVSLKENTDYTISYKNNKSIGTATLTITGKGNYTGSCKFTFAINPKKTTLSSLKGQTKAMTLKWSKVSGVTGYEIQYSTKSTFSSKKTLSVAKASTVSKKISSLSSKKTYYVRIRTYKTVNGKNYYSGWSKVMSAKTK